MRKNKVKHTLESLAAKKEREVNEFNSHKNSDGQVAAMVKKGYLKVDKDGNVTWPDGKKFKKKGKCVKADEVKK